MIGVSGLPHHFLGSFWVTFFVRPIGCSSSLRSRCLCLDACLTSLLTNLSDNGVPWASVRCGEGFGLRSLSLSHSFSLPRVMCGILAVGVSVTCISVCLLAVFSFCPSGANLAATSLSWKSMGNASADVFSFLASYRGALEVCAICVCVRSTCRSVRVNYMNNS